MKYIFFLISLIILASCTKVIVNEDIKVQNQIPISSVSDSSGMDTDKYILYEGSKVEKWKILVLKKSEASFVNLKKNIESKGWKLIPPSDEIEEKYDEKTGTIERIIHQRDPEKEILFKVDVSFSSLPFEKILEEANGIPEVDFSTAVDVRTFTNTLVR